MFSRNRCGIRPLRCKNLRETDRFQSLSKGTRNRLLGVTRRVQTDGGTVNSEGLCQSYREGGGWLFGFWGKGLIGWSRSRKFTVRTCFHRCSLVHKHGCCCRLAGHHSGDIGKRSNDSSDAVSGCQFSRHLYNCGVQDRSLGGGGGLWRGT